MQKGLSFELSHKISNMAFVCACLVVLIHIGSPTTEGSFEWWCSQFLKNGVCRIAVPFFFVTAGYFLAGKAGEQGWWVAAVSKRIRTLLLPYMVWSLVAIAYTVSLVLVANLLADAPLTRNLPANGAEWLQYFGLNPEEYPLLVPLWFIRSLFIFVLLSPLVWSMHRFRRGLFFVSISLWVMYLCFVAQTDDEGWGMILRFTFSVEGCAYFVLGMALRRSPLAMYMTVMRKIFLSVVAVLAVTVALWGRLHNTSWCAYAWPISYAVALWAVWEWLPSRPWPQWLTGQAFPLYLMHMFPLWLWDLAVANCIFLPQDMNETLMGYLLIGICDVAVIVGVAYLARHLVQKISEMIFGGR